MTLDELSMNDEIEKSRVELSIPTCADVSFLVDVGELAKIASTGVGFTPERKLQKLTEVENNIETGFSPTSKPLLIKSGETNVGCVEYSEAPKEVHISELPLDVNVPGNRWHIKSVAILPEFRRQGIWRTVSKDLEIIAKTSGVKYFSNDVGKGNEVMRKASEDQGYEFYDDPAAKEAGYPGGTKLFGLKTL